MTDVLLVLLEITASVEIYNGKLMDCCGLFYPVCTAQRYSFQKGKTHYTDYT